MNLAKRLLFGCCCVAASFTVFIYLTLSELTFTVLESSTGHEPVTRGLFAWLEFNLNPKNSHMQGYEGYMYGIRWPRLIAEIVFSSFLGIGFTAFIWSVASRLGFRIDKPRQL